MKPANPTNVTIDDSRSNISFAPLEASDSLRWVTANEEVISSAVSRGAIGITHLGEEYLMARTAYCLIGLG